MKKQREGSTMRMCPSHLSKRLVGAGGQRPTVVNFYFNNVPQLVTLEHCVELLYTCTSTHSVGVQTHSRAALHMYVQVLLQTDIHTVLYMHMYRCKHIMSTCVCTSWDADCEEVYTLMTIWISWCDLGHVQNVANGIQDFSDMPKYSYEELTVEVDQLPSGVDPAAREVSIFWVHEVGLGDGRFRVCDL